VRVIAGTARGVRLETPKGNAVRPTLDRVREALFSILGERVAGARFIDLYAGTGANGIEALSRGATGAAFVDSDPRCVALIRRNLGRAGLTSQAQCLQGFLPGCLRRLALGTTPYDIAFADPPFGRTDLAELLSELRDHAIVVPDGTIVYEHPSRDDLPPEVAGYRLVRSASYGDVGLSFFS